MSLPFVAFDATTTGGVSPAKDLEKLARTHTMIVTTTGGPTQVLANLQLSHDGVHWVGVETSLDASAGPAIATVTEHLARYVRVSLGMSGGTSPTATVTIASE